MSALRRILGILVMVAGILGLVLSLAGLVGVWMAQPTVTGTLKAAIVTLNSSITTSQQAMDITKDALGATVDSVDALSVLLATTAKSVEDTKPMLDQIVRIMGETLPSTLESTSQSLTTAGQAADVLDGAIKSLDTFRTVLSAAPLIGSFVEAPAQPYNPERSLSESLGDVASNLEGLPDTFIVMADDLDKADENLDSIESNLVIMSDSVGLISDSLREYQTMIGQSQASMESLRSMLTNLENNLTTILNGIAIALSLFFLWLLAAQVVILSQGWELYQGTAGRMESGEDESPAAEPVSETGEKTD